MQIKVVDNEQLLEQAFKIRITVFVEEQGVDLAIEKDEFDKTAQHILLEYDGKYVATARWRDVEGVAKLERVCVLKEYRKYGLGKIIVEGLEKLAKAKGFKKAKLHGQTQAKDFYAKLGYKEASEEFMEDGIAHILFVKEL